MRSAFFQLARSVLIALIFIGVFVFSAPGANWPALRGPGGNGICNERNLPLHWSTNENVRWRVPLADRGNS